MLSHELVCRYSLDELVRILLDEIGKQSNYVEKTLPINIQELYQIFSDYDFSEEKKKYCKQIYMAIENYKEYKQIENWYNEERIIFFFILICFFIMWMLKI